MDKAIVFLVIGMFVLLVIGLLIGVWIGDRMASENQEHLKAGNFKVFASIHKNDPDQLSVEVFIEEKGIGIAFDKDLFYILSLAVCESSNAKLYINKPVLSTDAIKAPGSPGAK